jgi:predicted RNase H-like HicB family nuclease
MADSTLAALPALPSAAGTDSIYVEQGGVAYEGTLAQLAEYVATTITAAEVSIADSNSVFAGNSVEEALEQLAGSIGGAVSAATVTINDSDSQFAGASVEEALEEIAAALDAVSGTAGKHAIYVAAGSITPSATGGCAALATIASAANQPDIQTLDFDATTQEYAQFGVVMPKSWNEGTVTFKAHWSHAATVTNFGVVWDLQAVAVSDDDAIAVAFGTAQTSTDTGGTTNDLYSSPESSAITVSGTPAAEDMVFFRLSRVTGNGSDTMAVDARLHGITLYITTNAENDA